MSTRADTSANQTVRNYITAEVQALIGARGSVIEAPDPVDRSMIRRFAQAIMDDDPLYWDDDYAARSRFGRIMAPPLFPLHAARRPGGSADPLELGIHDPDYDGAGDVLARLGLPELPIPQTRLLNGGNQVRVSTLAGIGDVIALQSTFDNIYQKEGRTGVLIFVEVRTDYRVKQTSEALLQSKQTFIWR